MIELHKHFNKYLMSHINNNCSTMCNCHTCRPTKTQIYQVRIKEISFNFDFTTHTATHPPRESTNFSWRNGRRGLKFCVYITTPTSVDLNGRQIQWKTNSMEDDLNGRRPQWKTTSMEDDLNGRQSQWKTISMKDGLNGRPPQLKTTSIVDDFNVEE